MMAWQKMVQTSTMALRPMTVRTSMMTMVRNNTDRPRPAMLSENEWKWATRRSNAKRQLIGWHNEPMKHKSKSVLFFQPLWLSPLISYLSGAIFPCRNRRQKRACVHREMTKGVCGADITFVMSIILALTKLRTHFKSVINSNEKMKFITEHAKLCSELLSHFHSRIKIAKVASYPYNIICHLMSPLVHLYTSSI